MPAKNSIDLNSPNLVECTIKRKNGTQVHFGHAIHLRTEYNFQPIDRSDKESPHVCDVPNDEHRAKFLDTKESYRLFNKPEAQQNVVKGNDLDADGKGDDKSDNPPQSAGVNYNDMLGLNADEVTTDFLKDYARDHLKISVTGKQAAQKYAKDNYGLELDGTMTVVNMHREIMKAEQDVQRKESEAAAIANK